MQSAWIYYWILITGGVIKDVHSFQPSRYAFDTITSTTTSPLCYARTSPFPNFMLLLPHHPVPMVSWMVATTRNKNLSLSSDPTPYSLDSPIRRQEQQPLQQHHTWMDHARYLYLYQQQHGPGQLPKYNSKIVDKHTYPEKKTNTCLAVWVKKQRQLLRDGTMSKHRIDILNQLNVTLSKNALKKENNSNDAIREQSKQEESAIWWEHFQEVRDYFNQQQLEHATTISLSVCTPTTEERDHLKLVHLIPRQTRMGVWLHRQRRVYLQQKQQQQKVEPEECQHPDTMRLSVLLPDQIAALNALDPDWYLTKRHWNWEKRFRELKLYADRHNGDCAVPISYHQTTLAHWVSNQRKQYNRQIIGLSSDLTEERKERLNGIGFVWNVSCSRTGWSEM